MRERLLRLVPVALVPLFLLTGVSNLNPSPAEREEDPSHLPDLEEILLLEELTEWLVRGPAEAPAGPLLNRRMLALLRDNPDGLQLFRRYAAQDAERSLLESLPYGDVIYEAATTSEVDSLLLASVVEVESSFRPRVVSPRGAMGLAQVMPTTARIYGVADPFDPVANLEAGARYLGSLLERFDADLELALAAYNAGPSAVSRYGGVPPYRETRRYVRRVLDRYLGYHRSLWEGAAPQDPAVPEATS